MIKDIENYEIKIDIIDYKNEFPKELSDKINKNFEELSKTINIWNGDLWSIKEIYEKNNIINIKVYKTNYAHHIYTSSHKVDSIYKCRGLSAAALIETIDNYYIVAEQLKGSIYENILQFPGGSFDETDKTKNNYDLMQTIKRELLEEINIDIDKENLILENKFKYIYITNDKEKPSVQLFTKIKLNMTYYEFEKQFYKHIKHIKDNKLEEEFIKVYPIDKNSAINDLEKIPNPKRKFVEEVIKEDIRIEVNK